MFRSHALAMRARAPRRSPAGLAAAGALFVLPALLAAAGAGGAAAQDHPGGFPALAVSPPAIDFGDMQRNEVRHLELTLSNEGGAPLHILNVASDCGCTVAKPEVNQLAPGQSTTMKVSFNSKGFEGPQRKHLTIVTNDPATPSVEVVVSANVRVPLIVNPATRQLGFGHVRPGKDHQQQAYLMAMEAPALTVRPVRFARHLFEVDCGPAPGDNPAHQLVTVRLRPDAPFGSFREVVRLETGLADAPTVDLEVFGNVIHDLEVAPEAVAFRYVERDQLLRSEVRVRNAAPDARVKVTGVEIDLPGFETKIEERLPGVETVIILTGRPLPTSDPRAIAAQGRMQGTLLIRTTSRERPEIPVRVSYLLKM